MLWTCLRLSRLAAITAIQNDPLPNGEHAAHLEASELGEKLEQAVHMALNEVVAILGFSLNLGGLQDKRVKPFRGERIWPKRR
jgi:hypothetical protein